MKHWGFLLLSLACFWFLGSCKFERSPKLSDSVDAQQGERLAKLRCSNCHLYPEPGLLPKETWERYILPRMGYMLGIYPSSTTRDSLFENGPGGGALVEADVFPEKPQISREDWEAICAFYLQKAPAELKSATTPSPETSLSHFRVKLPEYRLSPPSSTLVRIAKEGGVMVGDANSKALYLFDAQLKLKKAANTGEGAVDLAQLEDRLLVTVMGSFSPTDAPRGLVFQLPLSAQRQPLVLMNQLKRPVSTAWGDLNGDGRLDAVICEFSKYTGSLGWWEQAADGSFKKNLLGNRPGATSAYLRDLNRDGKTDVLVLFAQGDEGVFAYFNEGEGKFREENWLRFPPSYGSSFLAPYDFNGDGWEDLLYVCGDNADYPAIVKPYHGLRIYTNDGANHFKETWFYPLPGAYKALPGDFDQDGDQDLAAIAFFPDYRSSAPRSFVYLENQGNFQFKTRSFAESRLGRWITMDSGDVDLDGDIDLVLGSLAFEVIPDRGEIKGWLEKGIPFLVLENTIK
jgi:FG-GAP-like repeat